MKNEASIALAQLFNKFPTSKEAERAYLRYVQQYGHLAAELPSSGKAFDKLRNQIPSMVFPHLYFFFY